MCISSFLNTTGSAAHNDCTVVNGTVIIPPDNTFQSDDSDSESDDEVSIQEDTTRFVLPVPTQKHALSVNNM